MTTPTNKGRYRIKPVAIYQPDGVTLIARYPSITEASRALGLSDSAVSARIYGQVASETRIFKFDNPQDDVRINPVQKPQKPPKPKDRKIKPIPYKTRLSHICITPCPFRNPKPMVGSSACRSCSLFRGVDKELQIVSCAHSDHSPVNFK